MPFITRIESIWNGAAVEHRKNVLDAIALAKHDFAVASGGRSPDELSRVLWTELPHDLRSDIAHSVKGDCLSVKGYEDAMKALAAVS